MSPTARARASFALLAVIAIALSAAAQIKGREAAAPSPVPAIDNPGPRGLEAAYRYLQLSSHATALEAPVSQLPSEAKVLITALPYARVPGPEEREALWAWVARGGTVVVLGDHEAGLGALVPPELRTTDAPLSIETGEIGLHELGGDVRSLLAAATHPEEKENLPARVVMPDPLLAGVESLSVSAQHGFKPSPGPMVPIALAGDTPVALSLSHGQGRALFLSGPDVLANARLDQADNLQLLANLGAQGPVYFDEYHHLPNATEGMAHLFEVLRPTLLQLLLWCVVLGWSVSRRLGPIRPAVAEPVRTTRDYALQLGALYRRAKAESALCRDLEEEYRAWLEHRLGLEPGAGERRIEERLPRLEPSLARAASELGADLRQAQLSPPSAERFAELSRAWVALQHQR